MKQLTGFLQDLPFTPHQKNLELELDLSRSKEIVLIVMGQGKSWNADEMVAARQSDITASERSPARSEKMMEVIIARSLQGYKKLVAQLHVNQPERIFVKRK